MRSSAKQAVRKMKSIKRIPSRQMDDNGRATLKNYLFKRQSSITEYWTQVTDHSAKLRLAGAVTGIAAMATYQLNHLSQNPEIQLSKDRRQDEMQHSERKGAEWAAHREGKIRMNSIGLLRRNSSRHAGHEPSQPPSLAALKRMGADASAPPPGDEQSKEQVAEILPWASAEWTSRGNGSVVPSSPPHTTGAMVRHDSGVDILSRDTESFDKAFFNDNSGHGEHEGEEEVSEGSQTQDVAKLIRRASAEWSKNHRDATASDDDDGGDASDDANSGGGGGGDAPSDEHEGQDYVARIVRRASERYRGQQASDNESTPVAPLSRSHYIRNMTQLHGRSPSNAEFWVDNTPGIGVMGGRWNSSPPSYSPDAEKVPDASADPVVVAPGQQLVRRKSKTVKEQLQEMKARDASRSERRAAEAALSNPVSRIYESITHGRDGPTFRRVPSASDATASSSSSSSSSSPTTRAAASTSASAKALRREQKRSAISDFKRRESAKDIADDIVRSAMAVRVYVDGKALQERMEKGMEGAAKDKDSPDLNLNPKPHSNPNNNDDEEEEEEEEEEGKGEQRHGHERAGYTSWPRTASTKRQDSNKVALGGGITWNDQGSDSGFPSPYDPFGDSEEEEGEGSEGSQTQDIAKLVRRASEQWRKPTAGSSSSSSSSSNQKNNGGNSENSCDEDFGQSRYVARMVRRHSSKWLEQRKAAREERARLHAERIANGEEADDDDDADGDDMEDIMMVLATP